MPDLIKLVLCSTSPRRQQILTAVGLKFRVENPQTPEEHPSVNNLEKVVCDNAFSKAQALAANATEDDEIFVGADTLVVLKDEVIGKPTDPEDAEKILLKLSDATHRVITGLALISKKWGNRVSAENSLVTFRKITMDELQRYLALAEPYDKAGAYAVQGVSALFIHNIVGSYTNVMGLPIEKLLRELSALTKLSVFDFLSRAVGEISERLTAVKKNLAALTPREIAIVAVTKRQPRERLEEAYRAGLRRFGNNYVQEGEKLMADFLSLDVEWHFIGHIQSRKAKHLSAYHCVQSVERLEVAKKLGEQRVLIEVNLGGESQKSGIALHEVETFLTQLKSLTALKVEGLMAMVPPEKILENRRPYFAQLKREFDRLQNSYRLTVLSMGTSEDYPLAVQEGATMIRLGSRLLGERPHSD